ncbi:MAG: hypothetical protein Q9181_008162, partial [Wetmoreana brouardii]
RKLTLVICPAQAAQVWRDEISDKFPMLKVKYFIGSLKTANDHVEAAKNPRPKPRRTIE